MGLRARPTTSMPMSYKTSIAAKAGPNVPGMSLVLASESVILFPPDATRKSLKKSY